MSKNKAVKAVKQTKSKFQRVPVVTVDELLKAAQVFTQAKKAEGCPWPNYGLLAAAFTEGELGGVMTRAARKVLGDGQGLQGALSLAAVCGDFVVASVYVLRLLPVMSYMDAVIKHDPDEALLNIYLSVNFSWKTLNKAYQQASEWAVEMLEVQQPYSARTLLSLETAPTLH
jgi:hypothetical protein